MSPRSIFNRRKIDHDKAVNTGIRVDYGDYGKFWLRHAGTTNKLFGVVFERETRPYRRLLDNNELPDDLDYKIKVNVLVHSLLVKWEGVYDGGDPPTPYNFTIENAIKLFMQDRELCDELYAVALDRKNYLDELQDEAKNSPSS